MRSLVVRSAVVQLSNPLSDKKHKKNPPTPNDSLPPPRKSLIHIDSTCATVQVDTNKSSIRWGWTHTAKTLLNYQDTYRASSVLAHKEKREGPSLVGMLKRACIPVVWILGGTRGATRSSGGEGGSGKGHTTNNRPEKTQCGSRPADSQPVEGESSNSHSDKKQKTNPPAPNAPASSSPHRDISTHIKFTCVCVALFY